MKSQICTTKEQSQKLLAMGLKPETADMVYHYTKSRVVELQWELQTKPPTLRGEFWTPQRIAKLSSPFHNHPDGTKMTGEEIFDSLWGNDVPAWSLSRLLEMLPVTIKQEHNPEANWEFCTDGTNTIVLYTILGYDTLFSSRSDNIFDAMIETIEWLIKNNHFNKEYLEESNE